MIRTARALGVPLSHTRQIQASPRQSLQTSTLARYRIEIERWQHGPQKVAKDPTGTVSADIAKLRETGFTEREIVEATMFIAFRVAFSSVNDALGINPDWELVAAAPQEVVQAVAKQQE